MFAAILDRIHGGFWRIAPTKGRSTNKQLYFPDTNILITRFLTADGAGEVQDVMPIASSPAHPPHSLIRRVVCVNGRVAFQDKDRARCGYRRQPHELRAARRDRSFTCYTWIRDAALSLYACWGSASPRRHRAFTDLALISAAVNLDRQIG